jgi:hypothetical protein
MTVFARIAVVLNEYRPDTPLLVVEGRGTSDALARLPLELSGLTHLHHMVSTSDPRDFHQRPNRVLTQPWVKRGGKATHN